MDLLVAAELWLDLAPQPGGEVVRVQVIDLDSLPHRAAGFRRGDQRGDIDLARAAMRPVLAKEIAAPDDLVQRPDAEVGHQLADASDELAEPVLDHLRRSGELRAKVGP